MEDDGIRPVDLHDRSEVDAVHTRLAPQNPFPDGLEDSLAVLEQELGVGHPLQRLGAAGYPKGFVRPLCS